MERGGGKGREWWGTARWDNLHRPAVKRTKGRDLMWWTPPCPCQFHIGSCTGQKKESKMKILISSLLFVSSLASDRPIRLLPILPFPFPMGHFLDSCYGLPLNLHFGWHQVGTLLLPLFPSPPIFILSLFIFIFYFIFCFLIEKTLGVGKNGNWWVTIV